MIVEQLVNGGPIRVAIADGSILNWRLLADGWLIVRRRSFIDGREVRWTEDYRDVARLVAPVCGPCVRAYRVQAPYNPAHLSERAEVLAADPSGWEADPTHPSQKLYDRHGSRYGRPVADPADPRRI